MDFDADLGRMVVGLVMRKLGTKLEAYLQMLSCDELAKAWSAATSKKCG